MNFVVPSRGDAPRSHLPVAIIIDKSESTKDIKELLNKCIVNLVDNMKKEKLLKNTIDLLVIHYSSEHEVIFDFETLENANPKDLVIKESRGFTHTGGAILFALQRLDEKKIEWKFLAEKYYQPLLFLLTDGYPDAGINAPQKVAKFVEDAYKTAATELKKRESENKLVFIAAGIEQSNGIHADMKRLSELSNYPERILHIKEASHINEMERFFYLIYESTTATFSNTPVDEVINQIWFKDMDK